MNKKYGGLVSNPRNTKDTQVVKSITYTTNGTVVETVNLNAWPAATESNTPSPTPDIPIEGDVQLFADAECSEYPSGTPSVLYARVNNPWGATGSWRANSYIPDAFLDAFTPGSQVPDDPYCLQFGTIDDIFVSQDSFIPWTAGQIIQLNFYDPRSSTALVFDGSPLVFTKN